MKTVGSFVSPQEAHLLRIRLEDAGISANVRDEATTNLAPMYTHALGGIRVQVSEEDYAAAMAVVEADEPEVDLREGFVCPNCGSEDIAQELDQDRSYFMSFLILFLIMLPVPLVRRRYRCKNCEHRWK